MSESEQAGSNEEEDDDAAAADWIAALSHEEPPSMRNIIDRLSPPSAADLSMAAPSSIAASAASTVPFLSLSLAQRCDRDCLSIIFSFCGQLSHVVAAAQTCHSWRAASSRPQSSCRAALVLSPQAFKQMWQSSLRCHLACLEMDSASGEDLLQLHTCCPQLEKLGVWVDCASVAALTHSPADVELFNAHAWPSSLHSLLLRMKDTNSMGFQRLLDALPSSTAGLQSLSLSMLGIGKNIEFAPLQQLPHLTRLVINQRLSLPQLDVVKQLRALTELDLDNGNWLEEDFRRLLCEGPHHLQRLQKINLQYWELEDESAHGLLSLPSLTELAPLTIDPCYFSMLRSMSELRKLRVRCQPGGFGEVAADALLSSLRSLSHLTRFEMDGEGASAVAVRTLLDGLGAAVPQLRELDIASVRTLPLLNGLRTCTQLRNLRLLKCHRDDGDSVDDVLQLLPSLRHLALFRVFDSNLRLTDEQRAVFTPPSALVPSLEDFAW
jgi:hypothetical protein